MVTETETGSGIATVDMIWAVLGKYPPAVASSGQS